MSVCPRAGLDLGMMPPSKLPLTFPGVGPGCTDKTLLSAIASALHTSAAPITGQLSAAVEKNPGVWLNTTQPLCKAFIVTDEDIRWAALYEQEKASCKSVTAVMNLERPFC